MMRFFAIAAAFAVAAVTSLMPAVAGGPFRVQGICQSSRFMPSVHYYSDENDFAYRLSMDMLTTCEQQTPTVFSFESAGEGVTYGVRFTAPPEHCSPVRYEVWRGIKRLGMTRAYLWPTGPNQETVPIGTGFVAGTQPLEVRAVGGFQGCNAGALLSWAAIVEVVVLR